MFGISEPSAVHLLSALSPAFASSVWNSPEELSNNLIDSTAVNWRIPHYAHGKSLEKAFEKISFPKVLSTSTEVVLYCLHTYCDVF